MAMIKRQRPAPGAPRSSLRTLIIPSDLAEVAKVRDFVKESLEGLPLMDKDVFRIDLSLVEVCINIVLYAYPREKGQVALQSWHEPGRVYFEVRDSGIPFDPRAMKKPNLKKIVRTARHGGFGIFLSRTMMDGFTYKREDGQNVLTLFKKLRPRKPGRSQ
jgi:sigma-B regulation protein RsbU (phosphoserine phosphatase)